MSLDSSIHCSPILVFALQEHSAEYWPTKTNEPTRYGDLLVKLEDETDIKELIIRNFTITDTKVGGSVSQLFPIFRLVMQLFSGI